MGFFSKDDDNDADPIERMKNLVPLNTLSSEDLIKLKDNSTFKQLKKGEYAFNEGDTDPHNIYLLKGELALLSGKDETDSIDADAATARFPIAHDIPRKFSARAKTASHVAIIDNHLLSKLLAIGANSDYEVSDEVGEEDDWMTQLLQSDAFQQLPAASIQGVMMNMQEITASRGEKIVIKGGEGDFYLMHKGKADVIINGKVTTRLGPGDRFGEDALLSDTPRSTIIVLLTDSVLERLSRDDFLKYVQKPLENGLDLKDAESRAEARWLDVREADQFALGGMKNAENIPFVGFRAGLSTLDDSKTYICCCTDGKQSAAAAFSLIDRGYHAFYLKDGIPQERIGKAAPQKQSTPASSSDGKSGNTGEGEEDVAALKRRLAKAENTSKEYLDKLKQAKVAIDRSKFKRESEKQEQMAREDERKKMRDTLMKLKDSLGNKSSELEKTRAHAEEAAQMRERLERMDSLLTSNKQGKKSPTGQDAKQSESERKLKEELSRQEEEHGSLEHDLSKALNRLEEIESQRSQSQGLKKQLEKAQSEHERAVEQVNRLDQQELENHAKQDAAVTRVKDLEDELESRTAKPAASQDRMAVEEMRKQLEIARLERDQAQSDIDSISGKKQKNQDTLAKSSDAIFKLQREVEERERQELAQEEESKRTIAALEKQLEEVKRTQQKSEASTRAMEDDRKRMSQDLNNARKQIKEVEDKAGNEVKKLQKELEETRKRMEADARSGKTGGVEQAQASKKMSALENKLKKQQQDLNRSESEREGLKEFLESRSGELKDIKRALTDAQVEAEEADFRRQEAEEARKQVEDALSKLHDQVENEKAKHPVGYDEMGNEVILERKSKTGLVIGIIAVLGLGGGGYWFMNQPKAPIPVSPPVEPVTASTTTNPATDPTASPSDGSDDGTTPVDDGQPIEDTPPATVDRSNEPPTGTPFREALASGGEAPALVYIRGGEFTMGNLADKYSKEELPLHHVRVSSFYMGIYEVTYDEYDAFANATKRKLPEDIGGRGDRPVTSVKWDDATAYVRWLSDQTGGKYRLPSEAEWEYAARGGTKTDYWWGNSTGLNRANCFNCSSKWNGRSTAPVGTFKPNPFGLYNTAGNVMEWTEDCYNDDYRNAPGNGHPWLSGDCEYRVVRGGAYNRPAQSMRSSKRSGMDKGEYIPIIGFRVVRDIDPG